MGHQQQLVVHPMSAPLAFLFVPLEIKLDLRSSLQTTNSLVFLAMAMCPNKKPVTAG